MHRFKAGCLRPLDYTPSVLDRGAGAGCRTPACRLKAGCSAPELHPQGLMAESERIVTPVSDGKPLCRWLVASKGHDPPGFAL